MTHLELMAEFARTEQNFSRDDERIKTRLMSIKTKLETIIMMMAGTVNKKDEHNEN